MSKPIVPLVPPQGSTAHKFPPPATGTAKAHAAAVAPMTAGHAKHAPAIKQAIARKPLPCSPAGSCMEPGEDG